VRKEFLKKNIPSNKEFAVKTGLCFGCLEPGHLWKTCTKRKTCEVCGRLHPTPFHGDSKMEKGNGGGSNDPSNNSGKPANDGSATCLMSGQGEEQISSLIAYRSCMVIP